MEGSVDNLMGRVELHLDLAGIGVDDEGLMLASAAGAMTTARAKTAKPFIASPMESFDDESCFGVARFQLANACVATAAGWVTRVSLAVTRIAPGQTLRQNGSTARASALFKPWSATSARRIWGSIAERSFG